MGARVARLLHDGVPAGEIAIVLRDPALGGRLYRRVLSRFDIPVAVQADLPAPRTVTGGGTDRPDGGRGRKAPRLRSARLLRTPGIASPSRVDWFERGMRRGRLRSTEEALWPGAATGRTAPGAREIERLREAGSGGALLREAGRQARWIAELAIRRRGAVARDDRALELRAGAEIEQALGELPSWTFLSPPRT